jgi:Fe-S cluster biogenesis protein NfuA
MGVEIHRMRSWNKYKIVALLWVDAGMQLLQDLKAVSSCQVVSGTCSSCSVEVQDVSEGV